MTMDNNPEAGSTSASSVVSSLADAGRGVMADVRSRAAGAASRTAGAARAEAMSRAEVAKDSLIDEGARIAQTLRGAAEDGGGSIQSRVLAVVADSVEDLTASLRNRSLADLLSDAQSFARRNPGAFVAAAAVAGFALARFARSSAQGADYDYDPTVSTSGQGYATMSGDAMSGDAMSGGTVMGGTATGGTVTGGMGGSGTSGYGSGASASNAVGSPAVIGAGATAGFGESGYEGASGMGSGLGAGSGTGMGSGMGTGYGSGEGASMGAGSTSVSTSGMTTRDAEGAFGADALAQGDDEDADADPLAPGASGNANPSSGAY